MTYNSITWPRFLRWLRWRLGFLLSRLGEILCINWLIYNPLHFYSFHEHAIKNAPNVISIIDKIFPHAKKYLDIGAGSGAFAAECIKRGNVVVALEHNRAGRRIGQKLGVDMRPFDLMQSPPSKISDTFDLTYCFEVAEHLPPQLGDRLVSFAALKAPLVLFTAAPPGQTGTGHINEQPQSYWIKRFKKAGMNYRDDLSKLLSEEFAKVGVAFWFIQNIMVFDRAGHHS